MHRWTCHTGESAEARGAHNWTRRRAEAAVRGGHNWGCHRAEEAEARTAHNSAFHRAEAAEARTAHNWACHRAEVNLPPEEAPRHSLPRAAAARASPAPRAHSQPRLAEAHKPRLAAGRTKATPIRQPLRPQLSALCARERSPWARRFQAQGQG